MDTTYQRLDWGRSGILATIDASIRLTKAADRLGPTRIKKCHASFVAKCALLAMLDNAVNTLLAVLYGRVSERVECVVNAIDEDANAPEKLSGVKPSRVEGPNVQAQCVGVLDVQSVPGNSEDNVAAAVMLKRIFSGATAAEYTFVRGPLPPLHSPVCAPPVKQRMNDRCLDTRWNKLGESDESPMNANAVPPWLSAEAIGNIAPTIQFLTDPLTCSRALGCLDGLDSRLLELTFDFDDIVLSQFIN